MLFGKQVGMMIWDTEISKGGIEMQTGSTKLEKNKSQKERFVILWDRLYISTAPEKCWLWFNAIELQ